MKQVLAASIALAVSGLLGAGEPTEATMPPDRIEVEVDDELLHLLEGRIGKLLARRKSFVASDGELLGILSTGGESYVKVYILKGDRVESELTLQPPPGEDFNLFCFSFSSDQDLYVLNGLFKHYIYKKKQYLTTFEGVSRTLDFRDDRMLWSLQPRVPREQPKDGPPLLVQTDLEAPGSSDYEVLLRSDLSAAPEEEGLDGLIYQELAARYRKDGTIWAAGRFSGEIRLLSNTARKLAEYRIEPDAEPVDEQALEDQLLASVSAPLHKPEAEVVLHTPTRQVIVRAIATHGNDLLVLPSEYSKYHNTLIMLDSQSDRFYHFSLPEALKGSWVFAVTEEAVWFNSPVSCIGIDDLMGLVYTEQDKNQSGRAATKVLR
jgi:hypothetical protein